MSVIKRWMSVIFIEHWECHGSNSRRCSRPYVPRVDLSITDHFLPTAKGLIHSETPFPAVPTGSFSLPNLHRVLPQARTRVLLWDLGTRINEETCLIQHWSPFSSATFHHEADEHATAQATNTPCVPTKCPGQRSSITAATGLCS